MNVYGSFLPPNRVRGRLPAGVAAPNSVYYTTEFVKCKVNFLALRRLAQVWASVVIVSSPNLVFTIFRGGLKKHAPLIRANLRI